MMAMSAQAIEVEVDGQGEVTEEGMEFTVNEASIDPLSGLPVMRITGTLISNGALTVNITRSNAGITDEFCCGQCKTGNGETTEILNYTPEGLSKWYIHYNPAAGSNETITYTFSEGAESLTMTVHFNYDSQDVEQISATQKGSQKILKDGVVIIIKDDKVYHL
jgi:hypothetical protein